MAEKLVNAEAKVIEYIDVYYVETLFWGASSHTIGVGWPLVPGNLQSFIPIFMVKRRKAKTTKAHMYSLTPSILHLIQ